MSVKKIVFLLISFTILSSVSAMAQKKKSDVKLWEESTAREISPEVRMFITPQICDMKMLASSRQVYGPYAMNIKMFYAKSFSDLTNSQLENMKTNALYLAAKESDADAIIEPLFHSWVNEDDEQTVYVEVSGFPVGYYNFRPANQADLNMVGIVYHSIPTVLVNDEKEPQKKK